MSVYVCPTGHKHGDTLDQVRSGTHHFARRTTGPLGHALVAPNLCSEYGRKCRACKRERDRARHHGEHFDPARADEQFGRIVALSGIPAERVAAHLEGGD